MSKKPENSNIQFDNCTQIVAYKNPYRDGNWIFYNKKGKVVKRKINKLEKY